MDGTQKTGGEKSELEKDKKPDHVEGGEQDQDTAGVSLYFCCLSIAVTDCLPPSPQPLSLSSSFGESNTESSDSMCWSHCGPLPQTDDREDRGGTGLVAGV